MANPGHCMGSVTPFCMLWVHCAYSPCARSRPIGQMLCVYCASHQACIKVLQPSQLQAWLGA